LLTAMRAGVIGWPITHSRSPAIHRAAADTVGLDLDYQTFAVRPGHAMAAVRGMVPGELRGLSVTMPHKEAVLEALDEMSDVARSLGAVNCIVNTEGVLRGENTDGEGFLRGLAHEAGQQVAGHTVAVIGAGGAARSIALACARNDADSVMIINRTTERAEATAALAPAIRVGRTDDITRATLVVNATSLGMAGTAGQDVLPFDVAMLSEEAFVVEIVYDPLDTPLLVACRERDVRAIGGLGMLAGQAAAQFRIWTGIEPDLAALVAAAHKGG
jgi:shikimate dehydrogenase